MPAVGGESRLQGALLLDPRTQWLGGVAFTLPTSPHADFDSAPTLVILQEFSPKKVGVLASQIGDFITQRKLRPDKKKSNNLICIGARVVVVPLTLESASCETLESHPAEAVSPSIPGVVRRHSLIPLGYEFLIPYTNPTVV